MNCKPGDIAICIGDGKFLGWMFEVLYAAPAHDFLLPDGYLHYGSSADCWVLRSLCGPIQAPRESGVPRQTMYGVGKDSALKPLRDNDKEDETLTWAPRKETA
jgi:hypothetical protein